MCRLYGFARGINHCLLMQGAQRLSAEQLTEARASLDEANRSKGTLEMQLQTAHVNLEAVEADKVGGQSAQEGWFGRGQGYKGAGTERDVSPPVSQICTQTS
jgi:hypothetical protein